MTSVVAMDCAVVPAVAVAGKLMPLIMTVIELPELGVPMFTLST